MERSLCDALDAAVREISDAGAIKRSSAQRTEQAAELLRELSRRVNDLIARLVTRLMPQPATLPPMPPPAEAISGPGPTAMTKRTTMTFRARVCSRRMSGKTMVCPGSRGARRSVADASRPGRVVIKLAGIGRRCRKPGLRFSRNTSSRSAQPVAANESEAEALPFEVSATTVLVEEVIRRRSRAAYRR